MSAEKKKITSIAEAAKFIKERYEADEKIRKPLAKFSEPIQIICLDTNHPFMILVNNDQGIEVKDKATDANAPILIHFSTEAGLMELLNGELGAVKAYSSGVVKVIKGDIKNLLKLRKLLF
jgi:putative sterol carrier protein